MSGEGLQMAVGTLKLYEETPVLPVSVGHRSCVPAGGDSPGTGIRSCVPDYPKGSMRSEYGWTILTMLLFLGILSEKLKD